MASSTKKRKPDQDSDAKPLPISYVRQADEAIASAASASAADEAEDEEDIGDLLEPLSKPLLISLLRSAAASDPKTLAEIRRIADLDPSHRKIFVHSLGWETTSDALRAAFSPFGPLDDCRVVLDKSTGKSKGYGFVLFCHRRSARKALRQPQKLIDNRMTACQLASTGSPTPNPNHPANPNPNHPVNHNPNPQDNLPRKIYVSNVHTEINGQRLLAFFSQYGEIEEGPIGFNRQTGKPRGFALFVYRNIEGALKALEEPTKNFEGHLLVCQKATDSSKARAAPTPASTNPTNASNVPGNMGGYGGPGFGAPAVDMGLAQQAAMLGQGLLGMGGPQAIGQVMQPNAALLTMLAVAQNPAAFGIPPAVLTSLNPALASVFSAGGQQAAPPTAVQPAALAQGYGMGNSGYQNAGFQGPPGFQGTPQAAAHQDGGGGGSYQVGPIGQGLMQRPPVGPMGGYGAH